MHLRNFPHYYVKDDQRVAVYYTADARDLQAQGWKREETLKGAAKQSKEAKEAKLTTETITEQAPEKIEAVLEIDEKTELSADGVDFEFMTRIELLKYALDRGVDLPNNALKAELVEACKKLK